MSFEDKSFWMPKTGGCLQDGEIPFDDSSVMVEAKRPHHWFMDGNEADLFPSKKQAVEAPNLHTFSGLLNSNISPWGNGTNFQSIGSELTERIFDSESSRTIGYNERNFANMDAANNINTGRKGIEDTFGNDSSFGLSISHPFEDHRSELNYGGIRKVKVNQVKDSENFISPSSRNVYSRGDDNCMPMGLSFGIGNENVISMGDSYNRVDGNFISMGQPYNNEDDSTSTIGHVYQENCDLTINESFVKTDNVIPSINGAYDKDCEHNAVVSISQSYPRLDDGSLSQNFSKGSGNALLMNNCTSTELAFNNFDRRVSSMGQSFGKGSSNIISFGGFQDDEESSARILCSYGLLTGQTSVQRSETLSDDAIVSAANMSACINEAGSRKKDDKTGKKASPNSFPSNVRSLLSTGMLDGVPVKYMAWSREELRGIIQGSGYLCSCPSCNYSKAINAYEFERHASCKTKHPNNHIYFENGKTIYGIVQELRNTPQNLLFEVIQTITGSPINQKSFRLWKESFLAATRELQRIYGKDESKQLLPGTLI
ncbi:uncharacterized protein LOC124934459 isoform X2 [Impatiens glandulifera]|uniref:uncharacterized protein LOC124934459 isoform X2 n=1 Tax=Impatiens glandulifera TaxID=253017 RepID=UPI001FB1809E|nr:uncharacterized protein LOC124934459 isoform X2 [Impatiens glandulifera]